jgi:hypothetical protein
MTYYTKLNLLHQQHSVLTHVVNESHTQLHTGRCSPQYFAHPLKYPDTDNSGCSSSLYSSSVFPEDGSKQLKHVEYYAA